MIKGLYSAASGMIAIEAQQSATANNVANASTAGYKRQEPVQLGFYQMFMDELRTPALFNSDSAPGGGVKVVETYPDLAAGTLVTTEDPLNMALRGPGYFVIDTPAGERYTRSGAFTISVDGSLATADGHPVQRVGGGTIDVRGGRVIVDSNGAVRVNGVPAGQIAIAEFENPERLLREGDSLYAASEEVASTRRQPSETTVEHQQLEMSNVNLPRELTSMILGSRAYEANQRVILAIDETMGRLIDQVGFPS